MFKIFTKIIYKIFKKSIDKNFTEIYNIHINLIMQKIKLCVLNKFGVIEVKKDIRQKIRNKEIVLKAMQRIADPMITEIIAMSGVEIICLDNEHYAFSDEDLFECIIAGQLVGASMMVRVNSRDVATMSRVMDMGADGILAPQIESYEDALEVVNAVKYAPVGKRGFCPIGRSAEYGASISAKEYIKQTNENTIIGLMIETKQSVEDLDKILSLEEIDFIAVGPSDMSASYGFPGDIQNPVVVKAMKDAHEKAIKSSAAVCGLGYTLESAKESIAKGVTILNIGSDVQSLVGELSEHIAAFKPKK